MNKHLTTIENIKTKVRPMSSHIGDDRIQIYIEEAEQLDLKKQLGDSLFIDVLEYVNNIPTFDRTFDDSFQEKKGYPDYTILLNGGIYEKKSCSGRKEKRIIKGLIECLNYYVYARLVKNNNQTMTRFGFVEKQDQYSNQSDLKERLVAEKDARSVADIYMSECLDYLRDNEEDFPPFRNGKQKNKLRISIIGD